MNIGQIAKMAQQMQAQMAQAQQELAETTLEATAGGGAVRVVITGAQEVRSVDSRARSGACSGEARSAAHTTRSREVRHTSDAEDRPQRAGRIDPGGGG